MDENKREKKEREREKENYKIIDIY